MSLSSTCRCFVWISEIAVLPSVFFPEVRVVQNQTREIRKEGKQEITSTFEDGDLRTILRGVTALFPTPFHSQILPEALVSCVVANA